MKSPVKSVSYEPLFDMEITKQGFTIHRSDEATAFELEEFANRKVLSKKQEYLSHHINWWISLVNLDHLKVMAYMYCCLIKNLKGFYPTD